jgi:hypothetical protein
VAAWLSGGAAASPAGYTYPIVMKGPAALVGQVIANLAAYARSPDGAFRQIALQIDEVNARGDYVLSEGIPYTARTDDGILDENDEVVVRGDEIGRDFKLADLPPSLRSEALQKWKVGFRLPTHGLGYILLVAGKSRAAAAEPGEVSFDHEAGLIRTAAYTYSFQKGNPALLGEVKLAAGGQLIKSSKFLMPLRTPFFMPDLTFVDTDFSSQIESWQTGPIRSIVAVGVRYSSFLSLINLHLFSELVFYREKFAIPTKIEFIFDPSAFLKPGSGLFYSLSFPDGHMWSVDSNLAPLPARPADEVGEDGPKAAGTEVFQARGHQAQGGSFLVSVRVDPRARPGSAPLYPARQRLHGSGAHAVLAVDHRGSRGPRSVPRHLAGTQRYL